MKKSPWVVASGAIASLGLAFGPGSGISAAVVLPSTFQVRAQTVTTQQWTSTATENPVMGDFNGDGQQDVFFYGEGAAADALWLSKPYDKLDPPTNTADRFTVVASSVGGSYEAFAGDFDGNGSDDIFWYAPGPNPDSIWYYDHGVVIDSVARAVNGTYQPIVRNFDTNESVPSDDIFWYGPKVSETLWSGQSDRTFTGRSFASGIGEGAQILVGNFTADTNPAQGYFDPDLFFYIPGTTADSLWSGNGDGSFTVESKTVNGRYTPIVGNFDQGSTVSEFGGLTDIIWYTAGTASDTVWMNNGSGGFTSTAVTINGTYKPLVIPNLTGADTILWNNPSGGDSVWTPTGSGQVFTRTSSAWPGTDMGARIPLIGMFDDTLAEFVRLVTTQEEPPLGAAVGTRAVRTGTLPIGGDVTTTTAAPIPMGFQELPTYDLFWFSPGNAAAQTEIMWVGQADSVYAPLPTSPMMF